MTATFARACPAWCADHRVIEPADRRFDDIQREHNTEQIAWSDAGGPGSATSSSRHC
jgi:hypothetical protein